jgi:hypothetical protein
MHGATIKMGTVYFKDVRFPWVTLYKVLVEKPE